MLATNLLVNDKSRLRIKQISHPKNYIKQKRKEKTMNFKKLLR